MLITGRLRAQIEWNLSSAFMCVHLALSQTTQVVYSINGNDLFEAGELKLWIRQVDQDVN